MSWTIKEHENGDIEIITDVAHYIVHEDNEVTWIVEPFSGVVEL